MRLPADQRRQQLLDVARDVFAERASTPRRWTTSRRRAGVTKPVLYQHFPSKRALYVELLDRHRRQLLDARSRGATSGAEPGRERVEAGFAAYFRFVADNRAAFRLLFGASIRNDPEFAPSSTRSIAARSPTRSRT